MRVWKDTLYPGTVHLPDGRRVTFTPADVRHHCARLKDMLARQVAVPVAWNHQNDARPMRMGDLLAARAKHCFAHAGDVRISPAGALEVGLDVEDEADRVQLAKTKFVSPEIDYDVVDGDGTKWPGPSITHIAATGRPVQMHQQPFQLSADRPQRIRLSLEDYDVADEKPKKPEKKESEGEGEGGGEGASLKGLIEALKGAGLTIPEEVKTVEELVIAVKASSGGEGGHDELPGEEGGAGLSESPAPPIAMSLDAAQGRIAELERSLLVGRIEALHSSGRINEAMKATLLSEARGVRLSLDQQARAVPGRLHAKVEAYEALQPFAKRGGVKQPMREQAHPEESADEEMRQEARKDAEKINRGRSSSK